MGHVQSEIAIEEWSRCRAEGKIMLKKILEMERNPLFTQNLDLLAAEEKRWYSCYDNLIERDSYKGPISITAVPQRSQKGEVPPILYHFSTPPCEMDTCDLEVQDSPPTWSANDEVRVMANVQAYFQVAYKVCL